MKSLENQLYDAVRQKNHELGNSSYLQIWLYAKSQNDEEYRTITRFINNKPIDSMEARLLLKILLGLPRPKFTYW